MKNNRKFIDIEDNKKLIHLIIPIKKEYELTKDRVDQLGDILEKEIMKVYNPYCIVIEAKNKIGKPHIHVALKVDSMEELDSIKNNIKNIKNNTVIKLTNQENQKSNLEYKDIFIECTEYIKSLRDGDLKINNNRHLNNLENYLYKKENKPNTKYFRKIV